MRRLTELRSVETLGDLKSLPQTRCHELKGNRKGQFSVDLEHPDRLLFTPNHTPVPMLPHGGVDWTKVTKITIREITDTHD